ncbi:MAG: hypothetical protein HOO86_11570 [Bacteroidales bacterium]|nr:hypothetical protein [Bacteroidales bacterium]
MKYLSNILKTFLVFIVILSGTVHVVGQSMNCSHLDEEKVKQLFEEAKRLELAGDEQGAKAAMDQISQLVEADLMQALEQPIPDPAGLFCKPNPTTDYIDCILKLTARVELNGSNPELTHRGMERAKEGVELWTSQFAYTIPPVGDELCRDYLACIFKAMAQRELINVTHNEVDDLLQAKADEILEKGCDPCETKWVAVGKVDIEWTNDDEHVTIAGYAQWQNFHLIANLSELEDNCMHLDYDDRLTFPYACDGGVISHKGGKLQKTMQMTDGDQTFATDMVDADLIICASNTIAPTDLSLHAYLGFSEHGEAVVISLVEQTAAIKARKPFKVSNTVRNEEIPSYSARFEFYFYPISGWELPE